MSAAEIKPSTRSKYQSVIKTLLNTYKTQHPDGNISAESNNFTENQESSQGQLATWVIQHTIKNKYSKSYAVLVKSAMTQYLREAGLQKDLEILSAWDPRKSTATQNAENRHSRPSKRAIPKEDWVKLIDYFNTKTGLTAMRAQSMIAAGVGCGARPIEWILARLVDDYTIRIYTAKIKNVNAWDKIRPGVFVDDIDAAEEISYIAPAKDLEEFERRLEQLGLNEQNDAEIIRTLKENRQGKGNKIFRDVVFDPEHKVAIEINLARIDNFFRSKFGDNWRSVDRDDLERVYQTEYYNPVRLAVWRACRALFGDTKRYSPADTRSTFAANRRAKYGLQQTSADLGHSSTSITTGHYAGASKAWKS